MTRLGYMESGTVSGDKTVLPRTLDEGRGGVGDGQDPGLIASTVSLP